jgi:GDP-mannose 6-dehydrogenase
VKISVFGIGYVELCRQPALLEMATSLWLSTQTMRKLPLLPPEKSPIVEPSLDAVLQNAAASQRLTWTQSAEEAAQASDLSLVCVGTPSHPNGSLDLTYVKRVSEQIGRALKSKREFSQRCHALDDAAWNNG